MILAVLNHKGGVGKTTTAINLAAAYAESGARSLVIDLDQQASASLSLGIERDSLHPSTADVLLYASPVREAIRHRSPGPDVLPASMELIRADRELGRRARPERRLAEALAPIRDDYDFIFIDCPPSISLITVSTLFVADAYMVPVNPHHLAFEGLASFLQATDSLLEEYGGQPVPLLGILITMADYRNQVTPRLVGELRRKLGAKVFRNEIGINIRLAEAPRFGQSIFEFDPSSTGAKAYWDLAAEVLRRSTGGSFPETRREVLNRKTDKEPQ